MKCFVCCSFNIIPVPSAASVLYMTDTLGILAPRVLMMFRQTSDIKCDSSVFKSRYYVDAALITRSAGYLA